MMTDVRKEKVLPRKMIYNLKSIEKFSFFSEIATMFRTVILLFWERNISKWLH